MPLTVLGTIELNCRLQALAISSDGEAREADTVKPVLEGRLQRWLGEHLDALRTTSRG
jgi:hypothetical protein